MNDKKVFIIISLIISFNTYLFSEPWLNPNDIKLKIKHYREIEKECSFRLNFSEYPIDYGKIFYYLNKAEEESSEDCKKRIEEFKRNIKREFNTKKTRIGFQSKVDDLIIQDADNRFYQNKNIYISYENTNNNLAYKVKLTKDKEKLMLDESYLAYKK